MKVWECKVVLPDDVVLPDGADWPMRDAVRDACQRMAGQPPTDIFSGWGGKLTENKPVAGIAMDKYRRA